MPRIAKLSLRLYARFLHLYPTDFRHEFEDEMLHCFAQLMQDAWVESRWRGLLSAWLWMGSDALHSLIEQRYLFWRQIMFNKSHSKTLLVSMSIFVLTGIVLFCYGSYNLLLHPGSYLRKPAILFSWHSHKKLDYAGFIISRAENPTGLLACDSIPLSQFQTVPQTNLRSQFFPATSNSILPAEFHQIRDSYQVNRSSSYCYHVTGVEASGVPTSLGFYHWGPYNQMGDFVLGNLVLVLMGLFLTRLGIRLHTVIDQLPVLQPAG